MHSRRHSRRRAVAPILTLLCASAFCLLYSGESSRARAGLSPESPEVKAAVAKGIEFLRNNGTRANNGTRSFAAVTLMKAGVPPDDLFVQREIERILLKFREGYKGFNNYEPAVDLMALCMARRYDSLTNKESKLYEQEIQTIIDFLISKQNPGGDWDYYDRPSGQGDTSQIQFVLLGLWSATEEGFSVPQEVWERSARWIIDTQYDDGGFSYHPKGPTDHAQEHGMTVAGVTCLAISGIHLYSQPEISKAKADGEAAEEKVDENPFEAGTADADKKADDKVLGPKKPKATGSSSISLADLKKAMGGGLAWLVTRYQMEKVARFDLYYRYGVERMTALLGLRELGGHDWYTDGATFFLKEQEENGSWGRTTEDGTHAGTCFAILFLTRATWKIIKQAPVAGGLDKGQMTAKRGGIDLTNPGLAQTETGDIVRQEHTGPLEDILNDLLKNPMRKVAPDLGERIVEDYKAHPEKRKELIGQKDKLKQLVDYPNDNARIAALWALGRCEDLGLAPLIIKALGDNNVDVSVEARNALCVLSRKPLGEGLAAHPWDKLPEDAGEDLKKQAFVEWRATALERWKQWYARVRPYDQRDDLSDVGTNN